MNKIVMRSITLLLAVCGLMACTNSTKAKPSTADSAAVEAESSVETKEQPEQDGDATRDCSFENGVLTVDGVSYEFALVQGGTFTMGASPEVKDAEPCEKPARRVTIDHNYYIGKTEVTVGFWKAVTGKYPEGFDKEDFNKPVDNVSQDDVLDFLEFLQWNFGPVFCIPSEEEWEYAARGGNKSKHYIYGGSNTLEDVAWNDECDLVGHVFDVATKKPNELGIYDMSGNVWEWCSAGEKVVLRGGGYTCPDACCRVSYRREAPDADAFKDRYPAQIGFRLCIDENWRQQLKDMDAAEEEGI